MKKAFIFLLFSAIAMLVGYNAGIRSEGMIRIVTKTEHSTDTVLREVADTVYIPVPKLVFLRTTDTVTVPKDTVLLRESMIYTDDSTYTAYVSGIDASLDSIDTYQKIKVFTIHDNQKTTEYIYRNSAGKRWGVGVQAGYGVGRCGISPYIGIGVTYNIFRF